MTNSRWKKIRLGDFVALQRGHDLPFSSREPGNVPVMGSAGLTGYHSKAVAKGPGVTIGRSGVGSMGVVNYCEEDYWPHNTVLYVTDFKGNYPLFVYYLLKSIDLRSFDSGSAQSSLNRNYLYPAIISVPSIDTQKNIADFLFDLEKKIELNLRMNYTLESVARSVFHRWFVENEDVNNWEVTTLGDKNIFPLVPPGIHMEDDQRVFYIATGDVDLGTITNETEEYAFLLPSRANMQPGHGRIWFAKMKDSRKYLWTFSEDNDWWQHRILSTGFAGIQVVSAVYESYLYAYISSEKFDEEKNRLATGTTMQAVNTDAISSITLPIPPEAIVTQFDGITRPLYRKMWHNYLESRTLASLRDTLLPKLMRGEVRVKDV